MQESWHGEEVSLVLGLLRFRVSFSPFQSLQLILKFYFYFLLLTNGLPFPTNTVMFGRQRRSGVDPSDRIHEHDVGFSNSTNMQQEKPAHHMHMPGYNHNGHKVTKGIKPDGESGRAWIHPWHFLRICFKSTSHLSRVVNVLWPFVPAAIAIRYARPEESLWIFVLNYIAMIPTANLIGFAGQELARKLPKVIGKPDSSLVSRIPRPFS